MTTKLTSYPNLIGVFRRAFPIVTGQVAASVRRQAVTYYGQTYTIAGDATQTGPYAFDVLLHKTV